VWVLIQQVIISYSLTTGPIYLVLVFSIQAVDHIDSDRHDVIIYGNNDITTAMMAMRVGSCLPANQNGTMQCIQYWY
jgi:hypothetical protein